MTKASLNRWVPSIAVVSSTLLWLTPYEWVRHYYDAVMILKILYSLGVVFVYLRSRFPLKRIHVAAGVLLVSSMITSLFTEGQFTKLVIASSYVCYLAMIMQFQMLMKRDAEATMFSLLGVLSAYVAMDVIAGIYYSHSGRPWTDGVYFTGGKFDVGYNLMLWLYVVICCWRFFGRAKRPRAAGILFEAGLAACGLVFMVLVDSMTLVLAVLVLFLLLEFAPKLLQKAKPWALFAIFLGAAGIVFVIPSLLHLGIVSAFIQNVLGRSATLTGRERIYEAMAQLITQKPLFGLGRTTTYVDEMIGPANVQNGLMQVIYQYGFFGGIALSLLVSEYLRGICKARAGVKPVAVAFFLGFVVCSIVEIPYAGPFYYFIAISYALGKQGAQPVSQAADGKIRSAAFVSNYINHHQIQLADALYKKLNGRYAFIETVPMEAERKEMNWDSHFERPYIIRAYASPEQLRSAENAIQNSDLVIIGAAPDALVRERILKNHKITFKYAERLDKPAISGKFTLRRRLGALYRALQNGTNRGYLLCAGAFASYDFLRCGLFFGRAYKWGYFPPAAFPAGIQRLLKAKDSARILWVGRLIDLKHPELAVEAAARLRDMHCDVRLDIVGDGDKAGEIARMIEENGLTDRVRMLGAMPPEKVREHMEKAGIFLFTSDANEGWGAVLNEAMNSACAVVASDRIGAVPFMLRDGENGFVFPQGNVDAAVGLLKKLADSPVLQRSAGREAYRTVVQGWNAEIAADRVIRLADHLLAGGSGDLYPDGICSRARVIRERGFAFNVETRRMPESMS